MACSALSHGTFIYSLNFKDFITTYTLKPTSKIVWVVAVAYLAFFFALASGMINAIIEGGNLSGFILPTRSAQTVGETVVITLILFIGMAGTFMLYQSGRSVNPRVQQVLLIAGFGVLGIALLLGFILVNIKL